MKNCITRQLLFSEVSGCLVENPECSYVYKLGFSFLCRHPDHATFHAHVTGSMSKDEAQLRYDSLRQKRRTEYIAQLDETGRRDFCLQTDFFGHPQGNKEMPDS